MIDEQRKARDALLTLRQTHSVGEYIQKFESIVVCITDIQESEALHKFIHGLKADIKGFEFVIFYRVSIHSQDYRVAKD